MIGDEDDEDEILDQGTESEGTEGQDPGDGDEKGDLSPKQPDGKEDDGEPEEVVAEEARRPSRGEGRIHRLANETKAANEKAARLEQELNEFKRAQWQQGNQRSEQEERERLALMTPDERADYRISQMERRTSEQLRTAQIQTATQLDKTAYDAKATINPVYARYKDEVEERFQEQLRKGTPVEREVILKFLLGERALNGAASARAAAKQGKKRIDAQRMASGSGKGDAASQREKAGDTPEKRLQGVFI